MGGESQQVADSTLDSMEFGIVACAAVLIILLVIKHWGQRPW